MREQLADGTLVSEVRRLIDTSAAERLGWIRSNARTAMAASEQDPVTLSALTGVAMGTVKGFLEHTDTSIKNVLLIAMALGLSLADLERDSNDFAVLLRERRGEPGHASLTD